MLILSRKAGEEVVIAGEIRVKVIAIGGQRVRLGFSAPATVQVHREEVQAQRAGFESGVLPTVEALPSST